jgi:hypothetical protein
VSFAEPELAALDLPDDLLARVKPELRPGERLVWAGRPIRRPPISAASLGWAGGCLGLLYALAGLFLSIYFEVFFKVRTPIDSYVIFGTLFAIAAGLATLGWIVGGINSLLERQRVTREAYALTDQRALIWTPGETRDAVQFFSHDRGHFDRVHRVERPDGSGDLTFSNSLGRFNPGPLQFREVADVKRVESLARQFVIVEPPETNETFVHD